MSQRNPRTGRLSQLSLGILVVLVALSACGSGRPTTGDVDLTVRSLGTLEVTSVVATVSGPLLPTPRTFALSQRGSSAAWGALLGALPAGTNYVFTVAATDALNVTSYAGGASGITILNGKVTTVTITAQQTTTPVPFKNAVPVIDALVFSSTDVAPGDTISARAAAHDPDTGDTITFAWSSSPSAGGFSAPSAATTSWTAPRSEGDQTVVLSVTDTHGATTSASTVVQVSAGNGHGQAGVTVRFNTWPVITDVVATPGYLALGSPTSLAVTATDLDGDVLTYAWTSSCASGAFASPADSVTSFTLPVGVSEAHCDLVVTVTDGRGGSTTGQTTLPVGKPTAIEAPTITATVQSVSSVEAGGRVSFSVSATDPQGATLTFRWLAAAGVISNQVDGGNTSQIVWTAPATVAPTFTVSVVVTDAAGASVQLGFLVAGTCECHGSGPGNVPVTVSCGESACGSDYTIYACWPSGWSGTGQPCGGVDAGPCACNGTGPGGAPVTVACGESACGSDYRMYACTPSGWTMTGSQCGGIDAGPCACNGAGPGGAPVTVACGESACGSDYQMYACGASGWTMTGPSCGLDAGVCECNGTGPGGVAVTTACGQSACGSDYTLYACSASGWAATGITCP